MLREWDVGMDVHFRCAKGAEGVFRASLGKRAVAFRFWTGAASAGRVFARIYARLEVLRAAGVLIPSVVAAGPAGEDFVELTEWVDGEEAENTAEFRARALDVVDRMR